MSTNLDLALTLKARDEASRPIARAMQDLERQTQRAEKAVVGLSRESQRMASAREQLGVRSERAIQRELRQTEAAYKRLAASGTLSVKEQSRAYDAMRDKVAGLRREMAGVSQLQRGMAAGAKGMAALATGAAAGAYVLNRPLQKVEDYDLRLRYMANIAYAEQGVSGRQVGMREIREAIRKSGGNRDAAAETLDNMIASGSLGEGAAGRKAAFDMLPVVMKYATAGNANPNELVDIGLKAKKTLGITDPARSLEMVLLGGQLGGFEMKDMAKHLPQQMAFASMAGMSGEKTLAKLIALNQSAVVTAGSKDQAGNNVINFLGKLNAEETAKDFEKVGVKWRQRLIKGASQGKDAVDVFGETIDELLKKRGDYQKLQSRLSGETGEQKKETLKQMSGILQGAVVGQISSDQQELMGVIAYLNNRRQQGDQESRILAVKPGQASDTNLALVKDSAAWKTQQADNTLAEKQFDALSGLSATVGDVKLKLVEYADKYPALSTSIVGATVAVTALAAAAGAAALPMLLMNGGKVGALTKIAKPVTNIAARAAPAVASTVAGMGTGTIAPVLFAGTLATIAASITDEDRKNATPRQMRSRFGKDLVTRNAPSAAAPVPQGDLSQPVNRAASKLDAATAKIQQASSKPLEVQVKGEFRLRASDFVAVVNQSNRDEARRH
ncbi:phage tail tape measure protein [Craterilacuibacter sinensis]|uniref:Tail tape measure protein n=1 Tax=Craterilacuibacter sinensis TaxID=2686017 RepID=A0A845BK60_9NEIS|nr:phage tail tape measure protein [Craterilacuibacter sinensis]MXR36705.1 tail tape measure protein [Craterilacuibacter sinensis]